MNDYEKQRIKLAEFDEIWKTVPGYPNYLVSNKGRVRGPRSILKGYPARSGHLRILLYRRGCRKKAWIHRLVLEAFVGDHEEGMQSRHLNGDPQDNRAVNLEWSTAKTNQHDRLAHGTAPRGENNGNAKLTKEDAAHIRKQVAENLATAKELADELGVDASTVARVINGDSWKND